MVKHCAAILRIFNITVEKQREKKKNKKTVSEVCTFFVMFLKHKKLSRPSKHRFSNYEPEN